MKLRLTLTLGRPGRTMAINYGSNAVTPRSPWARSRPATAPLIEQRRIDELQSVLGANRFAGLLSLLAAECRVRPALVRSGYDHGDLGRVRATACGLQAAAIGVGAAELGAIAGRLGSAPDLADAAPLIEALDEAARATLCAAQALLGRPPRIHAIA